jgi:hypothetical protein
MIAKTMQGIRRLRFTVVLDFLENSDQWSHGVWNLIAGLLVTNRLACLLGHYGIICAGERPELWN